MYEELLCLVRVIVAAICGAAIGFERSRRQKEAGIRTHVIVALGSALVMVVSKYGFSDMSSIEALNGVLKVDPSRVASTIITGIGFIGAGVIFVRGTSIKGLTTAAGIFATAAVGMAIGAGLYIIGVLTALILVLFQLLLHDFFNNIENKGWSEITIVLRNGTNVIDELSTIFGDNLVKLQNFKFDKQEDKSISIKTVIKIDDNLTVDRILKIASENENIKSINL
ncbi:MAG: MgtC/SapB family protein [Ruminococcaceae bacterium]|nr:MgtC/SapB family protein [Oscillospiraceae bacterium]